MKRNSKLGRKIFYMIILCFSAFFLNRNPYNNYSNFKSNKKKTISLSKGFHSTTIQEFTKANPLIVFIIIFSIVCLIFIIVLIVILSKYRQAKYETRLEKSKAEAKARQEFLSRMSHEIRTPMNAIIGLTDVIKMNNNIPPELLENLNKIHSSAHYLLGLINNILDMSKLEQGKMTLSKEPFSLNDMTISLTNMLESEANRFGVNLKIEQEITNDVILADEIRLRQVLTNLLSNAFKYTPSDGNVKLKIKEISSEETTAKYFFSVTDSGIGIPPNEQQRIFKQFEQVDSNISRSMGTGLGLPISQNIVSLMGGEIKLKSEKNKGSEFSFELTFPLGKKEIHKIEQEENTLEGKNILIVEDNEINAEIIISFLEIKGAIVHLVKNGKSALEEFRSSPNFFYDAILMDIQMPVMDGLTATKQIRMLQKDDAKSVLIIAMTANTFKEDVDNAMDAGMNDFVPKPIDINNLYLTLENDIKNHKSSMVS